MKIRRQRMARATSILMAVSILISSTPAWASGGLPRSGTPAPRSGAAVPQQAEPVKPVQEPVIDRVSPVMEPRVGVDSNQIVYLSLHDAILKALENNNDIQVERTRVRVSEYQITGLRGFYDVVGGGLIQLDSSAIPNSNALASGEGQNTTTSKNYTVNINFQEQLPIFGGNWSLQFRNSRASTDRFGTTLNPNYTAGILFDYQQPLLKNFLVDNNRNRIRIAKKQLDISDSLFRQRVIEVIASVQRSYWDLVFAIRNVEIAKESMALAATNLSNNRKQVEAGTLAPIELAQSEAELETRRKDVISAIGNVSVAENGLKTLLLGDPNSVEWRDNLVPTESIDFLPPAIDYESAQRLALANRPELIQLRLQKEQNVYDQKFYRNQSLPQVDFIANYSSTGQAGQPTGFSFGGSNPFIPVTQIPDLLIGGWGRAFNTAIQNRFRGYAAGIQISFPIRNRTAQANLGQSKANARVLDFQQRQLEQTILSQVRNAMQNVETARQNIEASRAARRSREVQLAGEQKKFEAGLSTTFFVLTFQNQLSLAKGAELQALTSYNQAIAELQRVVSTTLDANNVLVTSAQDDAPAPITTAPRN
ncbi:MAG: TolC family protein [Acidobacteria bacterium]|nr:TolC family protein [Acidobacteriota bacterium]